MKKISFIFIVGFLAFSFSGYSQIKVISNGKVGINQNNPQYNLDWSGTGRFSSGYGQFIFDNSGWSGVATMHPNNDWEGCLGNSSKKFNVLYVDHVIARHVTETSDARIKENIVDLDNALEKIKKVRGVKYDIKESYDDIKDEKIKRELLKSGKNNIGFF
jgi:hypothetical protein